MNDRVSEELLAEAAGRHAARISGVTTVVTAEYKGQGYSFRDDGWFNATEAAQRYGKEPAQWQRLPATIEYVEAFKRRFGEITHVETSRARADRGGGTWLHPKLAVPFARWLDMHFSLVKAAISSPGANSAPGVKKPARGRLVVTSWWALLVARRPVSAGRRL